MQPEKWQRNTIFEAVAAGGLDTRECGFEYDDLEWRISHVPSGSYFLLQGDPGHYTATAVVGDDLPRPAESFTWAKVQERVARWAGEVKTDVNTPDLWAELRRGQGILTGVGYEDVENTRFTSDEQAQIVEQFRQITEFVQRAYPLSEVQSLSIAAKLDDIALAAGRVGRKDWRLLVGGAILSVIIADLLPREAVWDILTMALQGLGHLFNGGGGPPQLPLMT
jgi:hypothetical protein